MSRETENFSMYSLMSMRIMAVSSSNRNSARARASSVLPTPVGPRKRNEPIGRRGPSGRRGPGGRRRRRPAMASSWPTTRSCSRSSMWTSLAGSPSSSARHRDAGPGGDDLGDVVRVDLLLEHAGLAPPAAAMAASCSLSRFCSSTCRAVLELGGACRSRPRARPASISTWSASSSALVWRSAAMAAFSVSQLLLHGRRPPRRSRPAPSRGPRGAPWRRRPSPCAGPRARSPAGCAAARARRARRASSRSPCAAGWRPRPPGRSPCRAGSGRLM